MTTADKLALLKATKADIKAALTEQGQTPGDVFSAYPDLVRAIKTGVELPELTNPAGAEQIGAGYDAINASGERMVGIGELASTLADELTTQNTLLDYQSIKISELAEILSSKAASGGVDTCTITFRGYDTSGSQKVGYVVNRYVGGTMVIEYARELTAESVTVTDVVCGSLLYASGRDALSCTLDGGVRSAGDPRYLPLGSVVNTNITLVFQAPTTPGATGVITFLEDD